MDKNSKIFITGSKGMVGKNLVDELESQGFKNLILTSSSELDLMDREAVFNFFKKQNPDYVIHLAAVVGGVKDKLDNPSKYFRDNMLVNLNVIDACVTIRVKKLLNLSTVCIYPVDAEQPMKEIDFKFGDLGSVNEGYALSKINALKLCQYYSKENKLNSITLVASNLYGKHDKFDESGHVIASLLSKMDTAKKEGKNEVLIWGSGEVRREFLFAKDLAKIIICSLDKLDYQDTIEGIINCGSGQDVTIKELAYKLKEIVGFKGTLIFDKTKPEGQKRRLLDSDNLFKKINLPKMTELITGLKEIYTDYKKRLSE
jgi:GDP-L-fucose synthase